MFKRIEIKNFQSHKNTSLDLVNGVNVIVGQSDSGKTAIIRALRWLVDNRPSGFRFHSDFTEDETQVSCLLDSGIKITHAKKKNQAVYLLESSKGKEEFGSVGTNVPDQVKAALNLSDINFSYQMDKPFLITDSPGEVARTFNKVTRLERVDEWVKEVASKIRSKKGEVQAGKEKEKSLTEQIEELKYLDDLKKELDGLIGIEVELKLVKTEAENLESILSCLEEVKIEIKDLLLWLECEGVVKELGKLSEQEEAFNLEIGVINEFLLVHEQVQKKSNIKDVESEIKYLVEISNKIEEKEKQYNALSFLLGQLKEVVIKIESISLEDSIKKYVNKLSELKICPTCFGELSEETLKRVVEEI